MRHDEARALPPAEQAAQVDVLHLSFKTNIAVIQCEIRKSTIGPKTKQWSGAEPAGH
jgi:hypothetical protein